MKLSFVLCLVCMLHAFATGYSQTARISLSMHDVKVEEVLDKIEEQSEFFFLYNQKLVDLNKNVSIDVSEATINEVLNNLFDTDQIDFSVYDRQIILSPQGVLRLTEQAMLQQGTTITGTVTDTYGDPLPGVSILIKGTTQGTATDANGAYSLSVQNENAILVFSFVGFNTQEIPVRDQRTINVTLSEDIQLIEEVVVVGYGTQRKVNLTGAVATVSSKTIQDRPISSVGQALQGSVANLNVGINSGSAITSPTYNIRGYTSLNGGTPLIVIDGIVSTGDVLNRMNPTDIESISVLKDAASSAIYGSRAAFGVILVTTKTGKTEKLRVNYNNNFIWRTRTERPEIITDPLLICETQNIMGAPWYHLHNEEQLAYARSRSQDPSISPYFLNPDGTYSYFGSTDWVNEAYKKSAMSTTHSIDISGKTDRVSYFFSGSFYSHDGMYKYGTDKYNKYNVNSKLDFKLTDFWTIGNNTRMITSDYEAPSYSSGRGGYFYWQINRASSLAVPFNPDGTWTQTGTELGLMQDGGKMNRNDINISTQFDTRLDVIKNILFIKGNFAYNSVINNTKTFVIPVEYSTGPGLPLYYAIQLLRPIPFAEGNNRKNANITFDVYGTFMKTFNQHSVTAIAGFNQEEYRSEYFLSGRNELISTSLPSLNLATGDMSVGHSVETWALRGAFGRLNYTFADKYMVEFNGRYDGTSRFPKKDRFAFNPSASAGWVVSNEKFFESLKNVVSYLKFRASYGSLGNQDVSAYAYIAQMGSGRTSAILDGQQQTYVSAPGLVSASLTWEKVITRNFGIDLNLFKDRFTLTADLYNRQTKDMLTRGQDLPSVLGTAVPNENAADLETKGWDITVGWRDKFDVASKPLYYNVNFNLADSRAYITKFVNTTGSLSNHYAGKEIGEIWGLKTLGFFTSPDDIQQHADQTLVSSYIGTRPLEPGDLKFEDRNADGVINRGNWTLDNPGDYYVIGNNTNRYTFGLSLGAEWNGFDLYAFFQGVGKRDYAPEEGELFFFGVYAQPWTNTTYGNYYDRWTPETPNGYFPRFKSYVADSSSYEFGIPQTRYLQNAAYLRLKNLTAGYTIPENITQKIKIERLRFFFSGDNLFTISGLYKYFKVDPEGLGAQSPSDARDFYPLQSYYSFGINLTF